MSLRSSQSTAEKITEDHPVTYKTAQSSVTCIYQAHITGFWRNVRVLWSKNLMNHSLTVMVTSVQGDMSYCCKIDLKPWHFWNKRGYKSLEVEGNNVDVYWDFRSAKFNNNGPEPSSDFYVALVSEEEVVLLIGDHKKKAFKRTKSRPALVDAALFYKKENVFGKKSFSTRAKFHDRKKEHEIVVESSSSCSSAKDPEMWISVDGVVVVQVKNLQWKFRGNQTVLVDKEPVQVFWDVYDWLFSTPGTGHGLFIFKPDSEMESGGESEASNGTKTSSDSSSPEFCLFLYAWKLE
uniref:DUF868 domain-containing protein n=1 Tax=Noccaea caerulescens TaxID=107243 RepID=A0A1J3GSB8_NOCCA